MNGMEKQTDVLAVSVVETGNHVGHVRHEMMDKRHHISTASRKYLEAAKAANTRKAYQTDWQAFAEWCESHGLEPLPATPEMVGNYITHLAETGYWVEKRNERGEKERIHMEYKAATIQRKLASISQAHEWHIAQLSEEKRKNAINPVKTPHVRAIWQGIKREIGTAPKQKQAASLEIIKALLAVTPDDTLLGIRDRALLTIGFAGAFRRSELVEFKLSHVTFTHKGVELFVKKSKTDQEGKGEVVAIPFQINPENCPVRCLQRWIQEMKAKGITDGALFRQVDRHGNIGGSLTGAGVAYIIKRAAERAGFNPDEFAGHSLRRGFITTADELGKSEESIMRQTRHKSVQTMRRYLERRDPFKDNAAEGLGL